MKEFSYWIKSWSREFSTYYGHDLRSIFIDCTASIHFTHISYTFKGLDLAYGDRGWLCKPLIWAFCRPLLRGLRNSRNPYRTKPSAMLCICFGWECPRPIILALVAARAASEWNAWIKIKRGMPFDIIPIRHRQPRPRRLPRAPNLGRVERVSSDRKMRHIRLGQLAKPKAVIPWQFSFIP